MEEVYPSVGNRNNSSPSFGRLPEEISATLQGFSLSLSVFSQFKTIHRHPQKQQILTAIQEVLLSYPYPERFLMFEVLAKKLDESKLLNDNTKAVIYTYFLSDLLAVSPVLRKLLPNIQWQAKSEQLGRKDQKLDRWILLFNAISSKINNPEVFAFDKEKIDVRTFTSFVPPSLSLSLLDQTNKQLEIVFSACQIPALITATREDVSEVLDPSSQIDKDFKNLKQLENILAKKVSIPTFLTLYISSSEKSFYKNLYQEFLVNPATQDAIATTIMKSLQGDLTLTDFEKSVLSTVPKLNESFPALIGDLTLRSDVEYLVLSIVLKLNKSFPALIGYDFFKDNFNTCKKKLPGGPLEVFLSIFLSLHTPYNQLQKLFDTFQHALNNAEKLSAMQRLIDEYIIWRRGLSISNDPIVPPVESLASAVVPEKPMVMSPIQKDYPNITTHIASKDLQKSIDRTMEKVDDIFKNTGIEGLYSSLLQRAKMLEGVVIPQEITALKTEQEQERAFRLFLLKHYGGGINALIEEVVAFLEKRLYYIADNKVVPDDVFLNLGKEIDFFLTSVLGHYQVVLAQEALVKEKAFIKQQKQLQKDADIKQTSLTASVGHLVTRPVAFFLSTEHTDEKEKAKKDSRQTILLGGIAFSLLVSLAMVLEAPDWIMSRLYSLNGNPYATAMATNDLDSARSKVGTFLPSSNTSYSTPFHKSLEQYNDLLAQTKSPFEKNARDLFDNPSERPLLAAKTKQYYDFFDALISGKIDEIPANNDFKDISLKLEWYTIPFLERAHSSFQKAGDMATANNIADTIGFIKSQRDFAANFLDFLNKLPSSQSNPPVVSQQFESLINQNNYASKDVPLPPVSDVIQLAPVSPHPPSPSQPSPSPVQAQEAEFEPLPSSPNTASSSLAESVNVASLSSLETQARNIIKSNLSINADGPALILDVSTQTMHGVLQGKVLWSYPVSTAANGAGNKKGSDQTPLGVHVIKNNSDFFIGDGAPAGTIFEARKNIGKTIAPVAEGEEAKEDYVTSRILRLLGAEPGVNAGGNVDSFERFIYIHGTPESWKLKQKKPDSHGCIRMEDSQVIALFDALKPYNNIPVNIVESLSSVQNTVQQSQAALNSVHKPEPDQ